MVYSFHSIAWSPSEADFTIYTNALLIGIGMWSPELGIGHYASIHTCKADSKIFYYEAYIVVCAIHWASIHSPSPCCVIIFSDNSNTVDIFNSMKARGEFNGLLKFVVDIIMACDLDIWVIHVPGMDNVIADHLSRGRLSHVRDIDDSLMLLSYKPPMGLPGVGIL